MRKQQSGFTLIELIMVIVVLGILAAFALPKFANLGGDARAAAVKGLEGSIRSAAAIAHSVQLAQNKAASASVDLEGVTGVTMVAGYPTADANGIGEAAQIDGFTGTTGAGIITYVPTGFTGANCNVVYTAAVAAAAADPVAGTPAVSAAPHKVESTVTGCNG